MDTNTEILELLKEINQELQHKATGANIHAIRNMMCIVNGKLDQMSLIQQKQDAFRMFRELLASSNTAVKTSMDAIQDGHIDATECCQINAQLDVLIKAIGMFRTFCRGCQNCQQCPKQEV